MSMRGVALASAFSIACSTRTLNLTSRAGEDAGMFADDAGDAATIARDDAGVVLCGKDPCACANGEDDDADGLIDGFDPECTAPFDNDEASFATGLRGENQRAKCRDCFFDGNSGSGDDGCDVAASCATSGVAAGGACRSCEPSTSCIDACLPLVPNGCDCFGCCEVRTPKGVVNVLLADTCSTAALDNPALCEACTLSRCFNPCGECELCAGKLPSDLPPSCGAAGTYVCDDGLVCGLDRPCPGGDYCVQGCCVPLVL